MATDGSSEQTWCLSWWCPHEGKFLGLIIVDAVDQEAVLEKIRELGIAPSAHYQAMTNEHLGLLSFSLDPFKNRLIDEIEGEALFARMDADIKAKMGNA